MSHRLTHAEMADEIDRMIFSKSTWLSDFSHGRNKRPDWEIEIKRRELAVLQQAEADYRSAANRRAG